MLQGIDVSKWQGAIDWEAVARDGIAFAFVKATEGGHVMECDGEGYLDPRFEKNWAEAQQAGLAVGAYHFARVSHLTGTGGYELEDDAISEARWFWKVLERSGYDPLVNLPPVLDIEWGGAEGMSADQVVRWCLAFLSELTGLCGRKPIIYVGPNFWRYKLLKDPRFSQYPLWEVDINNPMAQPKAMGSWEWLFHQYSFDGKVEGIQGEVDLDVFRGDADDLRSFIEDNVQPTPPPPSDWNPPCNLGLPLVDFNATSYPRGEAVERIQAMLMSHGYGPEGLVDATDGLPDGVGGPLTRTAVGNFQRDAGLTQDYKVGEKTWWALIAKGIELTT